VCDFNRGHSESTSQDRLKWQSSSVLPVVPQGSSRVIPMKTQVVACLLLIVSVATAAGQQQEKQLLEDNAYEPIPSPDGKLVAYVWTGRKLRGGSGGLGRSNLQSDVKFCDTTGQTILIPETEGLLPISRLMRWSAAYILHWAEDVSSSSEEDHRHADSCGRH
jgi:hypothetical protein